MVGQSHKNNWDTKGALRPNKGFRLQLLKSLIPSCGAPFVV